jgi:penicillin-binding protein 1A
VKGVLAKILLTIFTLGFLAIFFAATVVIYFSLDLPDVSTLVNYRPPIPSQILARDGTVLANLGKERREVIQLIDIPPTVIDSFLAAEDGDFYNHRGVDYQGMVRALIVNLKAGAVVQGGSTITQQVAKSLLLTRERSIARKIKDILLAHRIEGRFSKNDILFLYLNHVYLGGGYYGVKAAFQGYFGKELGDVTVAESAIIAGLLVAPGRYSPYINPGFAKERQRYVLGRLLASNKISHTAYEQALTEVIKFRIRKREGFKASYFTEWVRQMVVDLVGKESFLENGFQVQTTLDWDLQQVAEREVKAGVRAIDKRQGFKGPIQTLDNKEDIFNFEVAFREEIFKRKSNFFILDGDHNKSFELQLSLDQFLERREHWTQINETIKRDYFVAGNVEEDVLLSQLNSDQLYKAVVIGVHDHARLIYVSLGGVIGVIPYKYFRWAHERTISERKNILPYIKRPSVILKVGDIIHTRIVKTSVGILSQLDKNFKKKVKEHDEYEEILKHRYLLCTLDQEPDVQGSLVAIQPVSGKIVALVGGTNFRRSQFNRVMQSKRQPGSAFKPMIFAAALENGFTPASVIIDSPESLGGFDASLHWKPRNYDGKFLGPVTLRNTLEHSRNVPTIKVAHTLGVDTVLSFLDRIGFNATPDRDLSMALGSFGITLMDMVATYAVFPSGGQVVDPKFLVSIIDRDGRSYHIDEEHRLRKIEERELVAASTSLEDSDTASLFAHQDSEKKEELLAGSASEVEREKELEEAKNPYLLTIGGKQVYDARLAYLMSNLLKGVVHHGTGRSAKRISHFLGGKTGTTNSYVDAWFIGFSANIVTGSWTGFDDNRTLGWGETGAKSALPIWRNFMRAALDKYGEIDFQIPPGIVNVKINKSSGQLVGPDEDDGFMEAFAQGMERSVLSGENFPITSPSVLLKRRESEEKKGLLGEDDYYSNQ